MPGHSRDDFTIDRNLSGVPDSVLKGRPGLVGDARTQNPRRGLFMFVLTRQNVGRLIAAAQNAEINRTVE